MNTNILNLVATVGAIVMIWGKLRGKLALEMVVVERLGQIGELASCGGSMVAVPFNVEVQI